jgi:hypothetical protein
MNTGLKKLLKFKAWLTVPETARYLSTLFGEDVTEADALRLALDGRLTLSVRFLNMVAAQCGKTTAAAQQTQIPALIERGVIWRDFDGVCLGDVKVDLDNKDIEYIEGIWDLPMLGPERKLVEQKYQSLTDGPKFDAFSPSGLLVNRPDGTWCQIVELKPNSRELPHNKRDEYWGASVFPPDAVFVVRRSALLDLETLMSEPEPAMERPMGQRERDNLLVIIAALANLAKVDVAKPSKAAAAIDRTNRHPGRAADHRGEAQAHPRRFGEEGSRRGNEGSRRLTSSAIAQSPFALAT